MSVKICGVCRPEDAALAASAGADYVGVILTAGFGRTRTLEQAESIVRAAEGAQRVGVFVDDDLEFIADAATHLRLDVLQLHGDESAERIGALRAAGRWRIWKTVRAGEASDTVVRARGYRGVVDGVLLEGWSARGVGGVGARFDWDGLARFRSELTAGAPLIVAGGLAAGNVGELITVLSPDVVDVSSGVEDTPGCKSAERVRAFVRAARGEGDA